MNLILWDLMTGDFIVMTKAGKLIIRACNGLPPDGVYLKGLEILLLPRIIITPMLAWTI